MTENKSTNITVGSQNIIRDILHGADKTCESAIYHALENSLDCMDPSLPEMEAVVVLAKEKNSIFVLDRGKGVSDFKVLVCARSDKPTLACAGSGLNMCLASCKELKISTIREGEQKHIYRVVLSEEFYRNAVESGKPQHLDISRHKVAEDPLKEDLLLDYPHGTQVEFKDIRPGAFPTIADLVEFLSKCVYAPHRDKVFIAELVDGKIANKVPLKKREVLGDVFYFSPEEDHPLLGKIYCEVAISKEESPNEKLMVGGMGPVCSMKELLRHAPAKFKAGLVSVELGYLIFDNPRLIGTIDCSAFVKYAVHSRDMLDWSRLFPKRDSLTPEMEAFSKLLMKLTRMIEKHVEQSLAAKG